MKKIILYVLVAGFLLGGGWAAIAEENAQQNKTEDKGPLTKITFVHYKNNNAKNNGAKNNGTACYGFLANGAKWKTTENYIVNPSDSGAETDLVLNAVASGTAEWEQYGGSAIFGNEIYDPTAATNQNNTDGKNVVYFGAYPDNRVIAVTTIWGYFSGSPKTREIVEWDMQFNTFYQWGDAATDSALMDLQNIATHELGHSAGMNDLYNTACNAETMFGYSTNGETSKRDLYNGDILGIQKLY